MVEGHARARRDDPRAILRLVAGQAPAAGRRIPRFTGEGARRRHPVRPVPAQHAARPRRPIFDRPPGAGDCSRGGRPRT